MSRSLLGDVCAYIPKRTEQDKPSYHTIGLAFIESDTQRISIKIDSIPIAGGGWEGWLNIFPRKRDVTFTASAKLRVGLDDIPF